MTAPEDWAAIHLAQKRLREAKRALRAAVLKRDRRAARIKAAVSAFEQSVEWVEAAQAALQAAQRANDQAFLRAVNRSTRNA